MRSISTLFALAAFCFSSVAHAREQLSSEPAQQPDWNIVRQQGEDALRKALVDPSSAIITWTHGFKWTFYKPPMHKKIFGWIGCGRVNAKNRMGGYVGDTPFLLIYDQGVKRLELETTQYTFFQNVGDYCAAGEFYEVQLEFREKNNVIKGSTISDELFKLNDLRSKGIITETEFQKLKENLLNN